MILKTLIMNDNASLTFSLLCKILHAMAAKLENHDYKYIGNQD